MEYYWNKEYTACGVLVSHGYGAGWSTWNDKELAYDRRVIEYWLVHKDNSDWMRKIDTFDDTKEKEEAKKFLEGLGYYNVYMGGFADIKLEWVPIGVYWRINEYDGAESIEFLNTAEWNKF